MPMRVPSLMNNTQQLLDLQRIKQQFSKNVLQLSSGQAIVDIADDPTGVAEILNYQAGMDVNSQNIAQVDTANSQLQGVATLLGTMGTDVNRLLQLGQEALSSSNTADSRTALGTEVDGLRSDFITLANTQSQGKYIFAGTKTTVKPFTDDTAATPQTVNYNGDSNDIDVQVGSNVTVATNIPGDKLFYGPDGQGSDTDLFYNVTLLRDGMNSNDTAKIQTAYDNLQKINKQLNVAVADVGSRQNGITALQTGLKSFNNTLGSLQSTVQSVDYPSTVVALNEESVAQQAALSTMAKANSKSLFDYLA